MTFGQRDDPAARLRELLETARAQGEPFDDHDDDDLSAAPAPNARDSPDHGFEQGFWGEEPAPPGSGRGRTPGSSRHARPTIVSAPLGLRERFIEVAHPVLLAGLVVAILAGSLFGVRVARARAEATSAPTPVPALTRETASATGPGTASAPAPAVGASGAQVMVHVIGQVADPGVVRVPAGARVLDAIAAAGGAGRKADLSAINLARPVVDGEQVHVPKPGEAAPSPGPVAGAATATGPGSQGKVALNSADLATLDSLPGVGPVLARRIVDWRTQNGRFASLDQLGEVSGIGEKLLAQLTPLVTVDA